MTNNFHPAIISSKEKTNGKILPYLSFPITKYCQFKCRYCGIGGETTASRDEEASSNFVLEWIRIGYGYGIRKFRLTGGEPLTHPQFEEIIDRATCFEEASLLVNTNGDLIEKKQDWLKGLDSNVRFAVSFDSLDPEKFDWITNSKGHFVHVMKGIKLLANSGNLTRLNLVITKDNVDEVFSIIEFCRVLGCDLKLLEVCSVPIPYNKWENFHTKLDTLEAELKNKATDVRPHEYSKSFGIPMPVYNINGVKVTLKSSSYGSRYDVEGICKDCDYLLCHEGLYDMLILPDGRLCGCRWSETSVAKTETSHESLDAIIKAFQRAELQKIRHMRPMASLPPFVCYNKEQ